MYIYNSNASGNIRIRNAADTISLLEITDSGGATFAGTVTAPEFNANVNNVAALRMKSTTSTIGYGVTNANLVTWSLGGSHPSGYYFRTTGANPALQIIANGNVGIGGSPNYELDVVGSIKASVQSRFANGSASTPAYSFDGDSDTGIYRATTNALGFSTAGTNRLTIDSSGNATFIK